MSVILQPQVAFPIVRQIGNHLDSTTYYVRAVVRDADGNTIATVNLASQGNQRYQTAWQVPADPTGRGIYISVVTSVYTSSAYTTKSSDYSDEETTYLVFDRVTSSLRGGGADTDYFIIRKIFKEELKKGLPEAPEPIEPKDYSKDFTKLQKAISDWANDILNAIAENKTAPTDLSPVLTSIQDAVANLANLVTSKEPNLDAVNGAIEAIAIQVNDIKDIESKDIGIDDLEAFKKEVGKSIEKVVGSTIKDELKGKFIGQFGAVMHLKQETTGAEEVEDDMPDLNTLTK